jgi:hypothetical protein
MLAPGMHEGRHVGLLVTVRQKMRLLDVQAIRVRHVAGERIAVVRPGDVAPQI